VRGVQGHVELGVDDEGTKFSACSEASETGKEKGVRVWHAMSRTVDNIDSSFLYGFYLVAVTVCD